MKMQITSFLLILSLSIAGACTDPPKEDGEGETGGSDESMDMRSIFNPFTDMRIMADSGMETDLAPMEESPCSSDEGCFAGRICQEGMCVDSECQSSADCPADRPLCSGPEGEEPAQRRGRCGDCRSDDDCYGSTTCVLFEMMTADEDGDEEAEIAGICTLEGACEGTLECAPSSRLVMSGGNQEVCFDRSTSEREPECGTAFNCQGEDECPAGLTCLESGECASLALDIDCDNSSQCGFGQACRSDGLCGACERG